MFTFLIILFIGSIIFVNNNDRFYNRSIVEVTSIAQVDEREVVDQRQNRDIVFRQYLTGVVKNGPFKGQSIQLSNEYSQSRAYHPELSVGHAVFVGIEEQENGALFGEITEIKRDQVLVLVGWLFIFTLLIVGRKQGLFAIISLVLNTVIIVYTIHQFAATANAELLLLMSFAVVVITILSIFFVSGFHVRTYAAILSTLIGTFALLGIAIAVLELTGEQGLRFEEMAFLSRPPHAIFMAGVLIGALGAVMDIGVSMASSLFALYEQNNQISVKALIESGREIGKDIMGTMTNILFFAYVSGTIPSLLLYFLNGAPLGFTLSMNLSLEITRALAGSIGIVLTIPIGLVTTILMIEWKRRKL